MPQKCNGRTFSDPPAHLFFAADRRRRHRVKHFPAKGDDGEPCLPLDLDFPALPKADRRGRQAQQIRNFALAAQQFSQQEVALRRNFAPFVQVNSHAPNLDRFRLFATKNQKMQFLVADPKNLRNVAA